MKLAEEGAKVVVADMAPADDTVAEIVAKGGTASAFAVNVSKQEEVHALVKYAIDTYGTLDIMVNNAGINRDGMLHKMPVENWQMVIDVDLTGVFFGTQEALNHMRAQGVNDGAAWDSMMQRIPMGYAGKPSDVGNMVAFLASDEAAYITSEVINVGGGMIV